MSDKLVFDLAQEVEGSPNVFVRKDWLNILDNQNQNYNNNQSIIDTSQLSNSNKYMSYREAYFAVPFLVTLGSTGLYSTASLGGTMTAPGTSASYWTPNASASSADWGVGLKSWFGQIIHSFTLDYNGTTIVQQTPFANMWNSFKLLTSMSYGDLKTQGPTIGFYPDHSDTWTFTPSTSLSLAGNGVCNNSNFDAVTVVSGAFNNFKAGGGNEGLMERQSYINFDVDGVMTGTGNANKAFAAGFATTSPAYSSLISEQSVKQVWKSYISKKVAQTGTTSSTQGYIQFSVMSTIYLKHVHSFFNMCPLLKGVFMKMTMNLNNVTTTFRAVASAYSATATATALSPLGLVCTKVESPLGGVNPLLIASSGTSNGLSQTANGIYPTGNSSAAAGSVTGSWEYRMNISVGSRCLDSTLAGITSNNEGVLSKSIYLYIPAYTFNPVFEQAYLSSPVKQIKYTDIYQYQVLNVASGNMFNNLLTNGIANVKSVLILPFYSSTSTSGTSQSVEGITLSGNTGIVSGTPVFQSPFDVAGTGATSPLCYLSNFNVQVSGQNAIYNLQKYNFEQFNNQLYGCNAVNGGLTDGITSGLISRHDFDMEYCCYYVNIERMLPVEMSVPKSIQILGQNMSAKDIDLYCFIEYGNEISIDALTGARV